MLSEIKDKKVRNIVRGALHAPSISEARQTIKKLRHTASANDTYFAYDYLYDSQLGKKFPLPDAFPETPSTFSQNIYFEPVNFVKELAYHRVYFERNKEKLLQALGQLNDINTAIFNQNAELLRASISTFSEKFGVSLIFLKKLISIKHSRILDEDLAAIVQANIKLYLQPYRHIAVRAFEDSVDTNTDYYRVRETFVSYLRKGYIKNDSDRIVLENYFNPLFHSIKSATNRLQAMSCFSCLDSILFLLANEKQFKSILPQTEFLVLQRTIPKEIYSYYKQEFENMNVSGFQDFVGSTDKFKEHATFRHSSNFDDVPFINNYRLNIERIVGNRFSNLEKRVERTLDQSSINIQPASIKDFYAAECQDPFDISSIGPKLCGNFHRTIYLIWMIEKSLPIEKLNGKEFLKFLDITMDVANLLSPAEITRYFPTEKGDLLHQCLSSALINDSATNDRAEHRLRKDLQALLIKEFEGNILRFVAYLQKNTPHVSQYFYSVSSEVFLTKLYDIFSDNSQVIETRCELLKWYAQEFDDQDSYNRAQSLKLDLKLQQVRGDIDDNRIRVDPARFLDWISENALSDLRDVASSYLDDSSYKSTIEGDIKNPVNVIQNPSLKLVSIIDKCFQEFCINKNYGVESYIGRRIRHGSLEGTMLSDIQEFINKKKKNYQNDYDFIRILDSWFESYQEIVKHLDVDLLRINSKVHKKGRIIPTITCVNKRNVLANSIKDIEENLKKGDMFKVPDFIYSYCWLFLEMDLNLLREELTRLRSPLIIDSRDVRDEDQLRCLREINSLTLEKFTKLSVWLQKPNNISPTTSLDLLFNAVVDEIKERYPNFNPNITMVGNTDINLHGHGYHFFYDILEILISNIARHGVRAGNLLFSFNIDEAGLAELKITSDVIQTIGLQEKIDALLVADLTDAMTVSGESGIKKLRVLQRDTKEIKEISFVVNEGKLCTTINLDVYRT